MNKQIGKQPPLKLKSATYVELGANESLWKHWGLAEAALGESIHKPAAFSRRQTAVFCVPTYAVFPCIPLKNQKYSHSDFSLSGGCFTICLSIFYKFYQTLNFNNYWLNLIVDN